MADKKINTTASMRPEVSEAELSAQTKNMIRVLGDEPKKPLFIPDGLQVQNPLPVAINGAVMTIEVGKEVMVPESIYNLVMNESNILRKNYGKTIDEETGMTVEEKARSAKQ